MCVRCVCSECCEHTCSHRTAPHRMYNNKMGKTDRSLSKYLLGNSTGKPKKLLILLIQFHTVQFAQCAHPHALPTHTNNTQRHTVDFNPTDKTSSSAAPHPVPPVPRALSLWLNGKPFLFKTTTFTSSSMPRCAAPCFPCANVQMPHSMATEHLFGNGREGGGLEGEGGREGVRFTRNKVLWSDLVFLVYERNSGLELVVFGVLCQFHSHPHTHTTHTRYTDVQNIYKHISCYQKPFCASYSFRYGFKHNVIAIIVNTVESYVCYVFCRTFSVFIFICTVYYMGRYEDMLLKEKP